MRSLFIVISKVYGLVQAYTGISYIFILYPMFRMLSQQAGAPDTETAMITTFHGEQITLSILSYSSMVVLTFGLAWLLIFKAEWLADKMKIPPTEFPTLYPVGSLVYAGAKLIGLYIIVQGIPVLIQLIHTMRPRIAYGGYIWSSIAVSAIRIIIGIILVLKTSFIMNIIIGKDRQNIEIYNSCGYRWKSRKNSSEPHRKSSVRNSEEWICSECGADVAADALVCPKCGADISEIDED